MTIPTPTPHDAMTAEEFETLASTFKNGVTSCPCERCVGIHGALRAAAAQAREVAELRTELIESRRCEVEHFNACETAERTLARIREAAKSGPSDKVVDTASDTWQPLWRTFDLPMASEYRGFMRETLQAALRSLLADGDK